jgi:PelA/Pel-15E family pectate lyase
MITCGGQASRDDVLGAMKKATAFMVDKVAMHGGYVWVVSEDLDRRWGEVPARPSQIWLQGGTERVGEVFLDAYEATGDDYYLAAARKAANALVYGQLPAGGWHYFIDFDPTGDAEWYRSEASKFRFGMEEYRYFYGNATFDDHVTQDAARFLLRFYNLTIEAAYRAPVLQSLDFVLKAQFPNGAWPQRFPLRNDYAHDGFPDYTSFYTLNDGAMQATIELLLEAWGTLGDPRYYESARLGMDAFMAMQGPADQACWGEQHGPDMRPIAARTHEPAGYVVRESIGVLTLFARFYLMTGESRYLTPIPPCLAWFDRINRESAEQKYPKPRYWEPGTNRPLYVIPTDEVTPEGYGKYVWTTDPGKTRCGDAPCKGDGEPIVDVAFLREKFDEVAALTTAETRAAYLTEWLAFMAPQPRYSESVGDIISALDPQGAWVTDGIAVNKSSMEALTEDRSKETVRGISTNTWVKRMSTLIASLQNEELK